MLKQIQQGYKVIIVGNSGVGKSCILLRFVDNIFSSNTLATIGVDFKFKTLKINGNTVKLQIWDTAGSDAFRSIVSAYYRGANAIVLVFKIDDQITLKQLEEYWMTEVNKYKENQCQLMLIANMSDIQDGRISKDYIEKFMNNYNIKLYFQTSAKNGEGIQQAFRTLSQKLLEKRQKFKSNSPNKNRQILKMSIGQPFQQQKKKKGCCK